MASQKMFSAFRPFLASPAPRALLVGSAISRFGDALDTVAFGWLVYRLTGSTLLMGMLYTVNALPNLLFGLAGGVLADRLPTGRTVSLLNAVRGLLVVFIAALAILERCPVYMLFVFTALNSTCEALSAPAAQKLPSLLLPANALDGYLGFLQGGQTGAELCGYALSGFVIAVLGMGGALLVDAATFFISAALVLFAWRRARVGAAPSAAGDAPVMSRAYMTEGLRHMRRCPPLLPLALYAGFINLMLAPFNALNVVYVGSVLGRGPETVGVMGTLFMAGTLLGGLLSAVLSGSLAPRLRLSLGVAVLGMGYMLLLLPPMLPASLGLPVTLAACVLAGLGLPISSTTVQATLLRGTPPALRGRVSAILLVISCAAMPLGSAAAGVLGSAVSLPLLFGLCGLMVLLCAVPPLLSRTIRRMDNLAAPQDAALEMNLE